MPLILPDYPHSLAAEEVYQPFPAHYPAVVGVGYVILHQPDASAFTDVKYQPELFTRNDRRVGLPDSFVVSHRSHLP